MVLRLIATLFKDPSFLARSDVTFEAGVIFANYTFDWVIVTITNVVSSIWNAGWTLYIVHNKSETIWTESFEDLSIEGAVLIGTVLPWLILFLRINILEVIIEEVFSFDQFATVPFSNVTSLKSSLLNID